MTPAMLNAAAYVISCVAENSKKYGDRRFMEREQDLMLDLLQNPPSPNETELVHREYRRKANDALDWVKRHLPDQYERYKEQFKNYLLSMVPQDDGKWSGHHYTHRYSQGSRDNNASESIQRGYIHVVDNIFNSLGNAGLRTAGNLRYQQRIHVSHERKHESKYRSYFQINKTPPPEDQSTFISDDLNLNHKSK